MLRYVEPGENDEAVYVDRTKEEAVSFIKEVASSKEYIYTSDEEALADYVSVHWAWEVEDDNDQSQEEQKRSN